MDWGRVDLAVVGEVTAHVYWSSSGEDKGNVFILRTERVALAGDSS